MRNALPTGAGGNGAMWRARSEKRMAEVETPSKEGSNGQTGESVPSRLLPHGTKNELTAGLKTERSFW